jgi:2-keto-4-pentenoate hydratase
LCSCSVATFPGRTSPADVLAASSGVTVGIEVLDSRYHDYKFTMADVVADNTSAGRFAVGPPVDPQGIDLDLVGVVLTECEPQHWFVGGETLADLRASGRR